VFVRFGISLGTAQFTLRRQKLSARGSLLALAKSFDKKVAHSLQFIRNSSACAFLTSQRELNCNELRWKERKIRGERG
jgi:hypothetical protein